MKGDEIDSLTGKFIDIDAKTHRQSMSKTLDRLQGRTDLGVRDRWAVDAVDQEDWPIVALELSDYNLPSVCSDFGLDLIDEWKCICADIQSVNHELVGMKRNVMEVGGILHQDFKFAGCLNSPPTTASQSPC